MRRLNQELGNWFRLVIVLAIVSNFAVMASGQQQKSPPAKAGVVSGRIFAITKSGDLKPARMATVVLLYKYRSEKAANANPEEMHSAGMAWLDNKLHAMNELAREDKSDWNDSVWCHQHLGTYHEALSATLSWASEKHKAWQILSTDADEDGTFKIAVPHPGKYTIVAIGQAGFNDAVWEAKDVVVNPGMTTAVKLSSPGESCLQD